MSVTDDRDQEQLAEGTLISHLVELRSRIMKAMLAVAIVFVCLLPFTQEILRSSPGR
jgi:sec-independent protein translocase protein TatC